MISSCGENKSSLNKNTPPLLSPDKKYKLSTFVEDGYVVFELYDNSGNIIDVYVTEHSAYTKFKKGKWVSGNQIVMTSGGASYEYIVNDNRIKKKRKLYVSEGMSVSDSGGKEIHEEAYWNNSDGILVYTKNYSYDEDNDKKIPHGKWTWYNEDGSIKKIEKFDMGKLVSSGNVVPKK